MDPMELHGIHGNSWKLLDPMEIHDSPLISMEVHGIHWKSLEFMGMISMECLGLSRIPVVLAIVVRICDRFTED